MIIGKNFFIIEIPKTGTSFLRNYFRKYQNVLITTHHDTIEHNPKFNLLKKNIESVLLDHLIHGTYLLEMVLS